MPAYRLTEQSEYELDEIWIYLYLNASETIANRQVSLLKDRFRLLAHHPEMGRSREDYGPRAIAFESRASQPECAGHKSGLAH
jgi:plasmid stabilization system protein ParE